MKRIFGICFAVFFACFITATFSACSEKVVFPSSSITLTMAVTGEGEIIQELDFPLQTEKMKTLGVKDNLIYEIKNNMLGGINNFRNEFYLSFLLAYSSSPDENFKIGEAVKVSEVEYNKQNDTIGFVILYRDSSAFGYFHGNKSEDVEGESQKKGIEFLRQTSSEGVFPFASPFTLKDGSQITVGERYMRAYKNIFNLTLSNDTCEKLDTPAFVYDYATPFSRLRTNADMTISSGGLYHNIWIRDESNFKDCIVKLKSTVVYAGWWYFTLLISVILIFAIALVTMKIYRKKRG